MATLAATEGVNTANSGCARLRCHDHGSVANLRRCADQVETAAWRDGGAWSGYGRISPYMRAQASFIAKLFQVAA
jgi:hypothetical protein